MLHKKYLPWNNEEITSLSNILTSPQHFYVGELFHLQIMAFTIVYRMHYKAKFFALESIYYCWGRHKSVYKHLNKVCRVYQNRKGWACNSLCCVRSHFTRTYTYTHTLYVYPSSCKLMCVCVCAWFKYEHWDIINI